MRLSTEKDLQCKHCGFTKSKLDLYCYFAKENDFKPFSIELEGAFYCT